jgi:hypothetical protein
MAFVDKENIVMSDSLSRTAVPGWFWMVATLGLAWNLFGLFKFLAMAESNVGNLMNSGLSRAQAELYANLPGWMTLAFAIGVLAGLAGSLLLLSRLRLAKPVFMVSLAAYLVLYIGDMTQGVFAAFGPSQVAILTAVVAIAAALFWTSLRLPSFPARRVSQ